MVTGERSPCPYHNPQTLFTLVSLHVLRRSNRAVWWCWANPWILNHHRLFSEQFQGYSAVHHSHVSHLHLLAFCLQVRLSENNYYLKHEISSTSILNRYEWLGQGVHRVIWHLFFRNKIVSAKSGRTSCSDVATYCSFTFHSYFDCFAKTETDLTYEMLCPIQSYFRDRKIAYVFLSQAMRTFKEPLLWP